VGLFPEIDLTASLGLRLHAYSTSQGDDRSSPLGVVSVCLRFVVRVFSKFCTPIPYSVADLRIGLLFINDRSSPKEEALYPFTSIAQMISIRKSVSNFAKQDFVDGPGENRTWWNSAIRIAGWIGDAITALLFFVASIMALFIFAPLAAVGIVLLTGRWQELAIGSPPTNAHRAI
jgi:hypothetical protein